jgi:WbqC-like protein family
MQSSNEANLQNNQKTVGILQPGYLPWLGFFEQWHRCDIFVLYDDVQFEKGSWRNRNRIKTASGVQWLTVPVLLKGQRFPLIKDVRINHATGWQKKHVNALLQNYSRASYFEQYGDGLFSILNRSWKYLLDLNLEMLHWLGDQLGITTPVTLSSELGVAGDSVQRLIDIIRFLGGKRFYEGSSGRNYIDPSIFEKAGITVQFQDYSHPRYSQRYGEFISHLSIIDLLFNCGTDSLNIIANFEDP